MVCFSYIHSPIQWGAESELELWAVALLPLSSQSSDLLWKLRSWVKTRAKFHHSWAVLSFFGLLYSAAPGLLFPILLQPSFAISSSTSLWPHGLQHTMLPCPSLSPKVCSNSCPLSQWCCLTISSSAALFSFCLQSFPASGEIIGLKFSPSVLHPTHSVPCLHPSCWWKLLGSPPVHSYYFVIKGNTLSLYFKIQLNMTDILHLFNS